jgi:hypothetical protein
MATALLAPLSWNPDDAWTRGTTIGARNPHIPVTIPAVVARHPHHPRAVLFGDNLDRPRWRRADAHNDLGIRSPDRQEN